jgi:YjbE family integral membrane protein
MVAAGLPKAQRRQVIAIGIAAATVMRILFAAVTVQLMQIVGLILAGGLLLLWVCWKLWREIENRRKEVAAAKAAGVDGETAESGGESSGQTSAASPLKSRQQAIIHIVIADLSMSLDNVLAVAGIARDHTWVLITGLAFSVAFMGLAAAWIARLLERHHWIAYVGLAVIFYVAVEMILAGAQDVAFSPFLGGN